MAGSEPTNEHKGSLATLTSSTTSHIKGAFHWDRGRQRFPISEAGEATTLEHSRWGQTKNHMKRFWWWYLLLPICFIAVILPCLFVLIIPAQVQRYIDRASLPLLDGSIEAVSANQIRVGLVSQVSGPDAFAVRLDAFDLHLSNVVNGTAVSTNTTTTSNDTTTTVTVSNTTVAPPGQEPPPTFLTLRVPAQTIEGRSNMTIDPQTVDVQNHTELSTFLTRAFAGSEGSVRVQGTTTARLGLLAYPVKFDKAVYFGGLQSLDGTNVTSTEAVVPADETDGSNIRGTLMVPNKSPFTLALGNTTCWVIGMMGSGMLDGYMGNTTVHDLVIHPGNQTIDYRGQLDLKAISVGMLMVPTNREVMERGLIQIAFRGNQTVVDGEHIGYLDEVLHKIDVFAEVPIEVGTKVMWGKLGSYKFDNVSDE